jgi:uncharacterized protein HemX
MSEQLEEISGKVAGQEFSAKGLQLNTLLTLLVLAVVIALAVFTWAHAQQTETSAKAFLEAVKEQTVTIKAQTQAVREQTCVMVYKDAEGCRRITQ